MPRAVARTDGLVVPGGYAALLALERDRFERSEQTAARMKAEEGTFFRRNTGRLLERLEAGEAVRVDRATVESALCEQSGERERLPHHRDVRRVEVSPDDRIRPAAN